MTTYCISGSRGITDGQQVKPVLDHHYIMATDHVHFGDAAGVDNLALHYCLGLGLPHTVWKADWNAHGKAAGPIRNAAMVKGADVLIAFWDGASQGTRSAIYEALKAGLEVHVYRARRVAS